MSPELAQVLINGAFTIVAGIRRLGMSTQEINERLNRVDNGQDAVTVEEVRGKLDSWQDAIDEGRAL